MKAAFIPITAVLGACLAVCSCQPAPEGPHPPQESAVLDYTLLGIWPDRFRAVDMTNALMEAGIRIKLSGYQPCLINVETAKHPQAHAIAYSNPAWVEGAQINPPAYDLIPITPVLSH